MNKEFNIGLLTGFIIGIIIFISILFWKPKYPFLAEQECRARFMSWCDNCRSLNWPNKIEDAPFFPSELWTCMRKYFDIDFPKTVTCDYTREVCGDFGIT